MGGLRDGYSETVSSAAYGAAVEHLLAAELLFRGHEVAWPAHDSGFDLIVDARLRVQCKGAARRTLRVKGKYEYAHFVWSGVGPRRANVDVYALFGADESEDRRRWWLVPAQFLASVAGSLSYLPSATRGIGPVLERWEDAWEIFEFGYDLGPQLCLEALGG